MKTFTEFVRDVFNTSTDPRSYLEKMYFLIASMHPHELSDHKDALLKIQKLVDDKLSGN